MRESILPRRFKIQKKIEDLAIGDVTIFGIVLSLGRHRESIVVSIAPTTGLAVERMVLPRGATIGVKVNAHEAWLAGVDLSGSR